MAKHTPEPWGHLEFYSGRRFRDVSDHGGRMMFAVMTPLTESSEQAVADGRRVLAAIAAFRGIDVETLEDLVFQDLLQRFAMAYQVTKAEQRAELDAMQFRQATTLEAEVKARLEAAGG